MISTTPHYCLLDNFWKSVLEISAEYFRRLTTTYSKHLHKYYINYFKHAIHILNNIIIIIYTHVKSLISKLTSTLPYFFISCIYHINSLCSVSFFQMHVSEKKKAMPRNYINLSSFDFNQKNAFNGGLNTLPVAECGTYDIDGCAISIYTGSSFLTLRPAGHNAKQKERQK